MSQRDQEPPGSSALQAGPAAAGGLAWALASITVGTVALYIVLNWATVAVRLGELWQAWT